MLLLLLYAGVQATGNCLLTVGWESNAMRGEVVMDVAATHFRQAVAGRHVMVALPQHLEAVGVEGSDGFGEVTVHLRVVQVQPAGASSSRQVISPQAPQRTRQWRAHSHIKMPLLCLWLCRVAD